MTGMFGLTDIEKDVMERLAAGEFRKSIAKSYGVSERTIARTIKTVFVKLDILTWKTDASATLRAVAKLAAAGDIAVDLGVFNPLGRVDDLNQKIRDALKVSDHAAPGHACSQCLKEQS